MVFRPSSLLSLEDLLNKLAKWRMLFAGWQLGTRALGDPESDAVRDQRELTILLRAEVNALTKALLDAGVLTPDRWRQLLRDEAIALDEAYERRFPGIRTTLEGLEIDVQKAAQTMRGWKP